MKLSTIATSTFLLVASAAADNNSKTAGNLKKRLLEDTMSMPATEDASDPDKLYWWHKHNPATPPPGPTPTPPPGPTPTPGCNGIPTTTCEGFQYLKLVTGDELGNSATNVPWTFFYENTPDGCVLAPIDTEEDLLNAQAAVAPTVINAWVGIFKEAADVCGAGVLFGDCPTGNTVNEGNWKNLDGTTSTVANPPYPGGDRNNVWTGNEPNNSPAVQQFAHIRSDATGNYLLRDLNDQNNSKSLTVAAAVYKCCNSAPLLTFADCSK